MQGRESVLCYEGRKWWEAGTQGFASLVLCQRARRSLAAPAAGESIGAVAANWDNLIKLTSAKMSPSPRSRRLVAASHAR